MAKVTGSGQVATRTGSGQIAPRTDAPPPAKGEGLVAVLNRNAFYRDGYRNLQRFVLLELAAIIGLVLVIIVVLFMARPEQHYFATTSDGRIIALVPLDQPNIEDSALLSWVNIAVTQTMTFGFHDYRMRLTESRKFFTPAGYDSFINALTKSHVLESIEKSQTVVSAVLTGAPIIRQQGVDSAGRHFWEVEMKALVTYQVSNQTNPSQQLIRLTVTRVSVLDNPSGVGIDLWIAQRP